MKLEKTELWITTERALRSSDARAIRGFFSNLYRTVSMFHGHDGTRFIYKHPLIQYKVLDGHAVLVGLKDGAYVLKAVPELDYVDVHDKKLHVVTQSKSTERVAFGISGMPVSYRFVTPWIALNTQNYAIYARIQDYASAVTSLLERILIGNLLSMAKALGYVVTDQIRVAVASQRHELVESKANLHLIGFGGEFTANFIIPDKWGIGKLSSRGYGTVERVQEA